MRNVIKDVILLSGLFIIACSGRIGDKNGEKYSTVVYYEDDFKYHNPERHQERTNRLLSSDTLYVFFETGFDSDTVEIKVDNNSNQTLYLTTDYSELADWAQYGNIKSIDKIEITKNSGRPVIINLSDKTLNLWAVNFYRDTLQAQRRKYLSGYE